MKILLVDEADNQKTDPTRFFIFGGIVFDGEVLSEITDGIERIRERYGFAPADSFKFSPNDCPESVTKVDFIKAKSDALQLARDLNIKFIGYALLHAVGRNKSVDELVTIGADSLLTKYQQFLLENGNSRGIAMFDTLPISHPNKYLRGTFQNRLEHEKAGHRLRNIDLLSFTTDGCSHAVSLCDICVGSFRYVVNEPERTIAGQEIMKFLRYLVWAEERDGKAYPFERGILLRPKK